MIPTLLRLVVTVLGLMVIPLAVGQEHLAPEGHNVRQVLTLLEQNCGYRLGSSIEQVIMLAEAKTANDYQYFSFLTRIRLPGRFVNAKMSFGCESPMSESASVSYQSPREIIAGEDAGGRYSRHVAWERAFSAANWSGRIAYVDSVFGDGLKSSSPGLLLICPHTFISLCPSFEVLDKISLKRSEVNAVVRLLETIVYSPPVGH